MAIEGFQVKFDTLEDAMRKMERELMVVGDFSSKALDWEEPVIDSSGRRVQVVESRFKH